MIVQIPALVSLLISFVSDFWAQNCLASFKIDSILSLSLMRNLLHNFVKVLWINKIDIFIVMKKSYYQWEDRQIKTGCQVGNCN